MEQRDGPPLLSIIVPTRNRLEKLKKCLSSIASLNCDFTNTEIIVVDDGSNPSCEGVVDEIFEEGLCLYLHQENKGPAAARNFGASKARSCFFVFLDDDCTLPRDWFENAKKNLDNQRMIGGTTINQSNSIFSEASQILVDYLYQSFKTQVRQASFVTSNNMIVPAWIFREIGGFSESFPKAAAEDRDFCARWLSEGYEICHIPEIVVEHHHDMNSTQFFHQHFNYGFGAFIYHRRKKRRNCGNLELEPLRFYIDLILFPFKTGKGSYVRAFNLSLCMCLSQICNCAGYVWAQIHSAFRLRSPDLKKCGEQCP